MGQLSLPSPSRKTLEHWSQSTVLALSLDLMLCPLYLSPRLFYHPSPCCVFRDINLWGRHQCILLFSGFHLGSAKQKQRWEIRKSGGWINAFLSFLACKLADWFLYPGPQPPQGFPLLQPFSGSSDHAFLCPWGLRGGNSYCCLRLFHNPLLDSLNLTHNCKNPCIKLFLKLLVVPLTFCFVRNCHTVSQCGCLHHFVFSPAMNGSLCCFASSLVFGVSVLNSGHSNRSVVGSHCCFNLQFTNDVRCWASFHKLTCYSTYIFFDEMSVGQYGSAGSAVILPGFITWLDF